MCDTCVSVILIRPKSASLSMSDCAVPMICCVQYANPRRTIQRQDVQSLKNSGFITSASSGHGKVGPGEHMEQQQQRWQQQKQAASNKQEQLQFIRYDQKAMVAISAFSGE